MMAEKGWAPGTASRLSIRVPIFYEKKFIGINFGSQVWAVTGLSLEAMGEANEGAGERNGPPLKKGLIRKNDDVRKVQCY
jgi:hypothetical protein